ncbi:MAG: RluA family pseudouridine synthase [Oscillospiraceae bacterium]|nr:RluA family pseudouridine synthase [Oscillospiraceae bacterium]
MEPISFPLTVTEPGRADAVLAAALDGLTRSAAQRWLEEGRVTQNGKALKKNAKLQPGDELLISPPQPEPIDLIPQDIPLDVVYEDGDVIVVNKPVGMVVHPAPGHPDGTLVNALLYHCKNSLSGINGELRPGIVHRIDRDTSGLLIAAKNDKAHLSLAAQLQDHSLFRLYHGVAVGTFREDSGTVSAPIGRHPADRKRMAVTPDGREAITHWQVIDARNSHSHIICRLETGRTHQIRVHMAYLGHPLLGDVVYGAKKPVPGLAGQCLHAAQLTFNHPSTGEHMTVEARLPEWFNAMLKRYELQ